MRVQPQKGFTLIEFVVAAFLLLLIVYVFIASVDTLRAISRSQSQTIAYHIAGRKIEELRKTPFSSFPSNGSFSDTQLSKIPFGQALLAISDFEGKPNIREVSVNVSWREKEVTKQVNFYTLIYEGGLHKD